MDDETFYKAKEACERASRPDEARYADYIAKKKTPKNSPKKKVAPVPSSGVNNASV